ncbi:MAG: hypothetical protein AAGA62_03645, partial [Bacteroidota bacterium]
MHRILLTLFCLIATIGFQKPLAAQFDTGPGAVLPSVLPPVIPLDCDTEVKLSSLPERLLAPNNLSQDCIAFDGNAENELSYSVYNPLFTDYINSLSFSGGDYCFSIQWEIEGGVFVFSDGSTTDTYCAGESSLAAAASCDFCDGRGFGPITYGPRNSFLRSTVKVRWDKTPPTGSDPKPSVKVKMKLKASKKKTLEIKKGLKVFKIKISFKEKETA